MNYCIIGGGPTGLSLAYILANNNYNITLVERDYTLGGSWKSRWVQGGYFIENAPRAMIMTPYLKRFFKEIGLQKDDFGLIYGSVYDMRRKFFNFFHQILQKDQE